MKCIFFPQWQRLFGHFLVPVAPYNYLQQQQSWLKGQMDCRYHQSEGLYSDQTECRNCREKKKKMHYECKNIIFSPFSLAENLSPDSRCDSANSHLFKLDPWPSPVASWQLSLTHQQTNLSAVTFQVWTSGASESLSCLVINTQYCKCRLCFTHVWSHSALSTVTIVFSLTYPNFSHWYVELMLKNINNRNYSDEKEKVFYRCNTAEITVVVVSLIARLHNQNGHLKPLEYCF